MNPLEGMTSTIGRFHNEELVIGDEQSRRRAREERRKQQRLHFAESSTWKRLNLADLRFERLYVEHGGSCATVSARCSGSGEEIEACCPRARSLLEAAQALVARVSGQDVR